MPDVKPDPKVAERAGEAFAEVAAVMARLRAPDGCPWDREQTLDSIRPHTLEEVYEVFDAIDRRDWPELRDELGDLLLQVLFYAQIAADEQHFTIDDVVRGLTAKLIRRHPHVFGDRAARDSADVIRTWESVKAEERRSVAIEAGHLLDAVPRATPALQEAAKLGSRAAKIGFDWPDVEGLFGKVQEEIAEIREELTAQPVAERVEEEFGDLLFVLTNLARHLHVDSEQALRKANAKFRRRFGAMEDASGGTESLHRLSLDEMEALWTLVKRQEAANRT